MKIVSSGRVLNSKEFYEKKKRKRRIQLILLSVGLLSVLAALIYFSRQEQFLVTEVTVLGENIVEKEEIAQVTWHWLAGYYLWIIPRANIFIYPRRAIKESLLEEFPRLKSVDLDLGEHRQLFLTASEHVPFALYCAGLPAQAGDCFFLDEEGLIFAPAPSFSDGVYFIYTVRDPIENPVGKRLVSVAEFKSLSKFREALAALDIKPSALEVKDGEYALSLSLTDGGQIMWRRDSDLTLIRSNLEAFLSDDSIRTQENFFDRILYLDLRTENKVFYKFKD